MPRFKGPIIVESPKPTLGFYSFGSETKGTLPMAQFEFDVTKFRDPTGQKQFAGMAGVDPPVVKWVAEDPKVKAVLEQVKLTVADLQSPDSSGNPRSKWISFSFKDHHGRMIAPAICEYVAAAFEAENLILVAHYGLQVKQ